VIACGVLVKDIHHAAQQLGIDIGTRFLQVGLHENPGKLRTQLQAAIDEVSDSDQWDRIAIGYGVCGRGTVDIKARDIPLAIPRVHDCISLFLGSNSAYKREFNRYPGTYYISAGWYEEKTEPLSQKRPFAYMGETKVYYDELVGKVGETEARETFEFLNSWKRNYQRAAFIDTGVGNSRKYANYARKMAEQNGWIYERLEGNLSLLMKLLTADRTTDEILVVPPKYVTVFNAREEGLKAGPVLYKSKVVPVSRKKIEVLKGKGKQTTGRLLQVGLGIDAGGTYTDVVIYDFMVGKVLCKNKALTTKWDFTVGIKEALDGLDKKLLARTELAAVSTTLATNAIVEGEGQHVGLLVMPPYGLFEDQDIPYEPKTVISGRLEISGEVTALVDETEVRQVAHRMVKGKGVEAFAVSGFAGSINPEQELHVKRILRDETGLFVTCGHELSDLLNFITRAQTAVLNARIVPRLVKLLKDLQNVLAALEIRIPVMVVKGDGSLMSSEMAMERPVETILSGPAASVAGARFLTNPKNAVVVDMGGTTTDMAALAHGRVRVCESGSHVGESRTHVKALEIRSVGLGGDSLISFESDVFKIGPRRVAPMAWLGQRTPSPGPALEYLQQRVSIHTGSSKEIHIFTLTGRSVDLDMTNAEREVVALLKERPHALNELAERSGAIYSGAVPVSRLERHFIIQRCGLTPTDLLHVTGRFTRWDTDASQKMCAVIAVLAGLSPEQMAPMLLDQIVRQLVLELIKQHIATETRPDEMDSCEVCQVLMDNLLNGNNKHFKVHLKLHRPIIGIGAPIKYFLPQAAELLGTEAVLPENLEVANAIGAITSHIAIRRQVKIRPDQQGGFRIEGLAGARHFESFNEAENYAKEELGKKVRKMGRIAGTSQTAVEIQAEDRTVSTAQGEEIFLERSIIAQLTGYPA
jgi:N-methylhydantoinase A/oxoprolinase/acetone carboxylase beta subunit